MKRALCFLLSVAVLLTLVACSGNYVQINLKEPIAIPENGIIEKNTFEQIKSENAISTFQGTSGEVKYEWKIFGSDIDKTRDVNLSVDLDKTKKGIKIRFAESEDFGFPAHLSIYLNEKWEMDDAIALDGNNPVFSVSVTGSKKTVLNIFVDKNIAECEIVPIVDSSDDTPKADTTSSKETTQASQKESTSSDIIGSTDRNTSSDKTSSTGRKKSDGNSSTKDKYETDPVPEGKPLPVEPDNQEINKKRTFTCTFSIECSTILNNLEDLDPDKRELIPSNGVILAPCKVTFYEGESVFDVLQRVCKDNGIHLEASWTPVYNSAYIEGIHNLYEFDCGELSGWMYRVNGWYPNYGSSRYQLADGEVVEWRYTCDLGNDIGRKGTW